MPETGTALATYAVLALLAVVHLTAGKMRFLGGTPRSVWLSAAGGISVAYVFVHVLPDLAEAQAAVAETGVLSGSSVTSRVRLVSLSRATPLWRRAAPSSLQLRQPRQAVPAKTAGLR